MDDKITVALTAAEIELLADALDSHAYWQLSEPSERRDAASTSDSRDVKECQELEDKLREALPAHPERCDCRACRPELYV